MYLYDALLHPEKSTTKSAFMDDPNQLYVQHKTVMQLC